MTTTRGQRKLGSAPPMSRVEWAIARYNWYRACGLLEDSPPRTEEVATYQRSPDPPPKPHLKWYPLNKPDDDIAATYQQPVVTTPRHRYSQRVDNPHPQKRLSDDPSTWSRVDWAIARYNWYRVCGLLEDLVSPTSATDRYQKASGSPRKKPHLKWYPLNKPDDATKYQQSVTATPLSPPGRHYPQRVIDPRARAILARYRAQKQFELRASTSGILFDESKHPRAAAGQQNGGQFIHNLTSAVAAGWKDRILANSIGGSSMRPGRDSLRERDVEHVVPAFTNREPRLVAGIPHGLIATAFGAPPAFDLLPPPAVVGHHPLPVAALKDALERKLISDDAVALAMETYLKDPGHGNKTYGGISHRSYNAEVKDQLELLIKNKKFSAKKPVDKATMNQFLANLVEGKGWNGRPVDAIGDFNDAILNIAGKYVAQTRDVVDDIANRTAAQIDEAIERCRGRARFWTSRFTAAALATVGSLLQSHAEAGQAALASPYLQEAIIELEKGNVDGARKKVLGEGGGPGSVMEDISKSVGSAAAVLNAQKAFEKLFADNFSSTAERLHGAGK